MNRLGLFALVLASTLAGSAAHAQVNCTNNPNLCGLTVNSTIEQPNYGVAIDVVLVGDGYLDMAAWRSAAASAIASFKGATSNMYGQVPALYNFHVVEVVSTSSNVSNTDTNDTALGMYTGGPYITAQAARVNLAAMNAPDADVVIAIPNGGGRSNASYPSALAEGGTVRLAASSLSVITHELGHALFHLADEYEEAAICATQPPSESGMIREPNVTTDPTCLKFQGLAGVSCIQGGKYCSSGVYRSKSTCLMRTNSGAACPACAQRITDIVKERRSGLNWGDPWVIITTPASGATLSGKVQFAALGFDDWFQPLAFAFFVDGAYVGAASGASSVNLPFDTARLADGAHTLDVHCADGAGHARAAKTVPFTTLNTGDVTAPTVSITWPTNGSTLSGTTYVSANSPATDVRQLVLSIDGVAVAASTTSNLSYQWDLTAVAPGTHQLTAQAIDLAENVGTATPVNVTVTTTTPKPQVATILAPADGSGIGPWFELSWRGGEGGSVGGQGGGTAVYSLLLDGALVSPNPLAGKTEKAIIDARTWALGPHQLKVRTDASGVIADSAPVFVVRLNPTTPTVFFETLEDYANVSGTVGVALRATDDAAITSITLRANGTVVGTVTGASGTVSLNTVPLPASTTLVAEALSSDGGRASATVRVQVDNTPPTVAITSPPTGSTVPAGALAVQVTSADVGTYVTDIALKVDGVVVSQGRPMGSPSTSLATLTAGPHTLVAVATDRAGNKTTSAPVTVTAANCTASGCNDNDACTADRCAATGACVHTRTPGCCSTVADCDDGDGCTTDGCTGGACTHAAIANCCNDDLACVDADACTQDRCSAAGGTCSHTAAGCCATAGDCNDGKACTTDSCVTSATAGSFCAHDWIAGCCSTVADCDDRDACTTDSCTGGTCAHATIAGCCTLSTECDDGQKCTADMCSNNACVNSPINGCCATVADCTTLNPCKTPACTNGYCAFSDVAGCCNFDSDCADADPCTVHSCNASHVCVLVSSTAGCADAGVPGPDAALPGLDAAQPGPDAALPGRDASQPGPDAAMPGRDASQPGPDAAMPGRDAAQPGPDAAQPGLDAAQPGPDAAQPGLDAAQPGADASNPGVDAAQPGVDAATVEVDAAQPGADAAEPGADAAEPVSDAAEPGADAAVSELDASAEAPDAADPVALADASAAGADAQAKVDQPTVTSGCGCGTGAGPVSPVFLLLGAALLLRRRSVLRPAA